MSTRVNKERRTRRDIRIWNAALRAAGRFYYAWYGEFDMAGGPFPDELMRKHARPLPKRKK